jgi:UTP--glucose-1-phosphate uridylyltransferase
MTAPTDGPAAHAAEKMRADGLPEPAVAAFLDAMSRVGAGESGLLPDAVLEPVTSLARLEGLPSAPDTTALERAVAIRLNGGLGTSMALTGPKSLIEVRDGLTFLDIVARQTLALRDRYGVRLPLVLMDSFATREASLDALARYPDLAGDVPLDFLQHREPKLRADDLEPVEWPAQPALEWCPPGHGDLYTALRTSGILDALLERGYRYAFVANVDNLGAALEPSILAWFADQGVPFLMEVVAGTEADRKAGHIARRTTGGLVLRESSQVPPDDAGSFGDIERWRFYNTNNLWIDLEALAATLDRQGGYLALPLILNRKTVDPSDPASPQVIQLESAMGAAIGVFDDAGALWVPRTRFAPVKTTDDLLVVRSDVYVLTGDGRVVPEAAHTPFVDLDRRFFTRLPDFEGRFPAGPPSLRDCERLVVRGDVTFGAGVVVRGSVEVAAPEGTAHHVEDGTVLEPTRA